MSYYAYDYGNGATATRDLEVDGGYYYYATTYQNAYTGYYSRLSRTATLYGDTVYRHNVHTSYDPGTYTHKYFSQESEGTHFTGSTSQTGYDIYTDGAHIQTYGLYHNYQSRVVVTEHLYGYGGPYGESVAGYRSYYSPDSGYVARPYSAYVYAYNGYTSLT